MKRRWMGWTVGVLVAGGVHTAAADRMAELERQVEALAAEVERIKLQDVAIEPDERAHGLSPAASKIYHKTSGVSLGGYGEALYQNFEDDAKTDRWDFLRFVLYAGYRYNDRIVLNTELEVEHASTDKEGYVSVEFAYIDYLWRPELNLRGGIVLVPVGLLSEFHEPTTFFGARRPDTESRIIPSTWRENGVGIFGDVAGFSYKVYLLNGFKGEDFTAAGVRGGRQKGSEALANDLAGVFRLDYTAVNDLLIGASVYHGDSGQDLPFGIDTTIADVHLDWKWKGFSLRALGALAELDGAGALSEFLAKKAEMEPSDFDPVGERMIGWYVEAGFDLFSVLRPDGEAALTPFVRFESYNTQDKASVGFTASGKHDVDLAVLGVNFKPIEEVVLKAEYQIYDDAANSLKDQWNLALGYIF